jgi:L-malate glycosyltransferase
MHVINVNTPDITGRRTRVLSITKSTGGLSHYNTELCKRLDPEHFDVHVICLSDNNIVYAEKLREMGIDATPMAMKRYAISLTSDVRLLNELRRFLKQNNYDVIIGHGSKAGFLVRVLERITGTPAIYALASMSFVTRIHGRKAHIYRQLERLGALAGGHIVTVAHATRNALLENSIIRPNRVTAIHTGIDLEKFNRTLTRAEAKIALGLDPERHVIGWAARLAPQKGPMDFVEAARRIIEVVPDVQIFMAGEGDLADEVDARIDVYNLRDNLIRAPWQTDVPAMLSAFDIYMLSSYWEGLPLSVLEAMAMGCATVATAVDGTVEVIEDGQSGYLVPAGDDVAMADRIVKLITDGEHRQQIATAGRRRVETHFHVDRMIKEWQDLLEKAAQQQLA